MVLTLVKCDRSFWAKAHTAFSWCLERFDGVSQGEIALLPPAASEPCAKSPRLSDLSLTMAIDPGRGSRSLDSEGGLCPQPHFYAWVPGSPMATTDVEISVSRAMLADLLVLVLLGATDASSHGPSLCSA